MTFQTDHPLASRFRAWIEDPVFPCVGAKAALGRGQLNVVMARDIRSAWDDLAIVEALIALGHSYRDDPVLFQSLAVVFEVEEDLSEAEFERHLWKRVQSLSDKDEWLGQRADPRVSSDPDDPHFSLSFGGQGFFVVGLHPNASRLARRFEAPVLVFNLHDQFERLREQGRYEKMRAAILSRDEALAGDVNPMLARHGDKSEAAQYSGRQVGDAWRCPMTQRRDAGLNDARRLLDAL